MEKGKGKEEKHSEERAGSKDDPGRWLEKGSRDCQAGGRQKGGLA